MPPLDDIALHVMAAMAYITYSLLAILPLSPDQRLAVETSQCTSLYVLQQPWRRS